MGVDLTISKDGDEVNFPKRGDEVTIHWEKSFDSSVDRGDPFKCKIGVGQVIRGWDEAIPKLSLGTKATLDISSDYAYGKSGFGSVARLVNFLRFSDLVKKIKESYPISEITPQELHSSLTHSSSSSSTTSPASPDTSSKQPPIIIDVREKDEQLRGIIPTAIPLPRGVLERDVERKVISVEEVNDLENGRDIVIYCAGGLRSTMAAESLVRLGYKKENVKSLVGGYDDWKESGFEVADYETSKKV